MPLASGSAARSVLVGRYAECAIGGTIVGLCFEWSVKFQTPTADVTAMGDYWEYNAPLPTRWTFTAKQYVPISTGHSGNTLYTRGAFVAQFQVVGYYDATGATGTNHAIFSGTGTPTDFELNAPMDMATQNFTIQGNGPPDTAGGMS